MSVDDRFDTGSKDRATVALVYRAVDDLGKLTEAEFRAIHERLKPLDIIPTQIAGLHERQILLEARVLAIEKSDKLQLTEHDRRRAYRIGTLPTILISAAGLLVTVLNILIWAGGGQ